MPSKRALLYKRLFFRQPSKPKYPILPNPPHPPSFYPPTAHHHPQPTMSALPPPSFYDDGASITHRHIHGLPPAHVAHWITSSSISSINSSETSAYTGSFYDDGADMLFPTSGPGFGEFDKRFYEHTKRKEGDEGFWNEDVQRAVSGDIRRNLERVRGWRSVEVRKRGEEGGEKREEMGETVMVPVPRKWGTFLIKMEDGGVVVVDREGNEFYSGEKEKEERGKRWVRAVSSVEGPTLTEELASKGHTRRRSSSRSLGEQKGKDTKETHSHRRKKSHHKHVQASLIKPLTPIQEFEDEDGYTYSGAEDVRSPTGFYMTGGASGWPSPSVSSVTAASPPNTYHYPAASTVKTSSPVRSLPGGWPSPLQSPSKISGVWERASTVSGENDNACEEDKPYRSQRSESSRHSRKSGRSREHDHDKMSKPTYSTYKAPTVEDAFDTSSDSKRHAKKDGWSGSVKSGTSQAWEKSRKGSKKGSENGFDTGWAEPSKTADEADWKHPNHDSYKGSRAASERPWGGGSDAAPLSEHSWDGFELPKSMSEVSVVGSDSFRTSLDDRALSCCSGRSSRRSRRTSSRASGRYGERTGWEVEGSQVSMLSRSSEQVRVEEDGWDKESERRGGTNSYRKERCANGFDETDETHLNGDWGGGKVRVGSKRSSVVGWD